ncbi:MAG: hypothetical protein JWN65_2109 [Solirubrobacterales bacterium]|nr:hypothetical protein [Solirubrobacterales bacterium]
MDPTNVMLSGLTRGGDILESTVRKLAGTASTRARPDRWNVVSVNRQPQDIMPGGRLPGPLAELQDKIEVQVRPAPGDKGSELAARIVRPPSDGDGDGDGDAKHTDEPHQRLRVALRHAKMILETGEVLESDKPSTTRTTITNLPLEFAIRRAQGMGRL